MDTATNTGRGVGDRRVRVLVLELAAVLLLCGIAMMLDAGP